MLTLAKKHCLLLLLACLAATSAYPQQEEPPLPAPVYVPSPQDVVDEMMQLADVKKGDVLYDLGCGDGRIVISAAKLGARGVGVDINPERVKEANENAEAAGVTDRVKFVNGDLFATDVGPATVVSLYLLPARLAKLKPKLLKELKPGTRIVAHDFALEDWPPDKTLDLDSHQLFLWVVPERKPEGK